jgi:hypothetical protein
MAASDPFSFAHDEFSTRVCDALRNQDFEAIEELRDGPVADYIPELVAAYGDLTDWNSKDLVVHLIQDCTDDRARDAMLDALDSPTVETRAVAICVLNSDFALFDSFLVDGWVDASRVDAAIDRFRS